MYRPPEDGAPGQFWLRQYSRATLYRETTPGFDAVIAEALERSELWGIVPRVPAEGQPLDSASARGNPTWLWGGGLVGAVVLLLTGGALVYRRRVASRHVAVR